MYWLHIITSVSTVLTAAFLFGTFWLDTRRIGLTASLVVLHLALVTTACGGFLHLLQTAGVL